MKEILYSHTSLVSETSMKAGEHNRKRDLKKRKNICTTIFSNVAYEFDKGLHKGLEYELFSDIPKKLLKSYMVIMQFWVKYEED